MERRAFTTPVDSSDGKIVGLAAVFNQMSENLGGFREIIAPGAFDSADMDDTAALVNHEDRLILGRASAGTLSLSIDDIGLRYEVTPPDTSYANDLMVSLERGDITQSSFGFTIARQGDEWDENEDGVIIRTITKVARLFDVSPVTFPAYPDATAAKRGLDRFTQERKIHHAEHRANRARLLDILSAREIA